MCIRWCLFSLHYNVIYQCQCRYMKFLETMDMKLYEWQCTALDITTTTIVSQNSL